MSLRWKKHPKETGLASVGAGPQGSDYWDGETRYATVYPYGGDWRQRLKGWYWVCSAFGKHINTCNQLAPDEATAKKQASDYVKSQLKDTALSIDK